MCCVKSKLCRRSRKSVADLQSGLSIWIKMKSPSGGTDGEMVHNWVKESDMSERNEGFGLGHRATSKRTDCPSEPTKYPGHPKHPWFSNNTFRQ